MLASGVKEGALLNLMMLWNFCCILFNLTWASFIISIVHSPVEASCGPLI